MFRRYSLKSLWGKERNCGGRFGKGDVTIIIVGRLRPLLRRSIIVIITQLPADWYKIPGLGFGQVTVGITGLGMFRCKWTTSMHRNPPLKRWATRPDGYNPNSDAETLKMNGRMDLAKWRNNGYSLFEKAETVYWWWRYDRKSFYDYFRESEILFK